MDLQPLLSSPPAIQVHVAAAVLALAIGIGQFSLRRGTPLHRLVGWSWIVLMAVAAGSSFLIHEIRLVGPWSPIHLLSVFTLAMLVVAVRAARHHRVRAHRNAMISLFAFALIGAGAFAFLPGRLMSAVLFG